MIVLPKGTIIRIGLCREVAASAHGLVIEYVKDVEEDFEAKARVLENPNDWWSDEVHHEYRPETDTILRVGYNGNANDAKTAKIILKQAGDFSD